MLIETRIEELKDKDLENQRTREDYFYYKGYSEALEKILKLLLNKDGK